MKERFIVLFHVERQQYLMGLAAVMASLDVLARASFAAEPTIGEISVACALGYLDFRMPDLDWKSSRPTLAAWYAKFCEYPSMKATTPSAP